MPIEDELAPPPAATGAAPRIVGRPSPPCTSAADGQASHAYAANISPSAFSGALGSPQNAHHVDAARGCRQHTGCIGAPVALLAMSAYIGPSGANFLQGATRRRPNIQKTRLKSTPVALAAFSS